MECDYIVTVRVPFIWKITKHIDVRFQKIRELVSSGELLLEKAHTSKNATDMLTKPVTTEKFKQYRHVDKVCYHRKVQALLELH